MQVTITDGNSALAQALASRLVGSHSVRLMGDPPAGEQPAGCDVLGGDLRDPDFAAEAMAGSECLVDLQPLQPHGPELDAIDCATRGTYVALQAAMKAGVQRVVLASSLELFRRLPFGWRVSEHWRPRPEPIPEHLVPWLSEVSTREIAYANPARHFVCLRLGHLVRSADESSDRRDRLHLDDAVTALERALNVELPRGGWFIFHIVSGGPRFAQAARPPFEWAPVHDLNPGSTPQDGSESGTWHRHVAPPKPIASRPIHKVVVYGAGGPLASASAPVLASSYQLRLTDLVPLETIVREERRQSPNAPLPELLGPPHEMTEVDVTDPDQVAAAAQGMDAILNCTVIRHDLVGAFRVNTLGAFNIARAAVANGIRRVVQTGPQLVTLSGGPGYWSDYDVPGNAPPRAGDHLYGHSKYLGQEILRVFADYYDLEIPVLLFCIFVDPERDRDRWEMNPFTVSWSDAARAIRRALEAESLPSPYEVMNICADLPQDRISNDRARELLGWAPRHSLRHLWTRES